MADIRKNIKDYGLKLIKENLVQGTWGNISVRVDRHYMYVTPSGLDYASLEPKDMIKVNIHTLEYDLKGLKPTSEKGIHAGILQKREEINALIHSHPKYSSVYAATHSTLEIKDVEMQALFNTDILLSSKYALPSTNALTKNTIKAMGTANAVFMANHGVMCAGKTLEEAFKILQKLEELAYQNLCFNKLTKN